MNHLKRYKNLGDFHTHTVYSLHGMSSPTEMVDAAIAKGLKYIALTDHYYPKNFSGIYDMTCSRNEMFMKNQSARIHEIYEQFKYVADKIAVIPGYEHNVFTNPLLEDIDCNIETGSESVRPFNLIGAHNWFYEPGRTSGELLVYLEKALNKHSYQCFAHLERQMDFFGGFPDDRIKRERNIRDTMTGIIEICVSNDILLEVNESSLTRYTNSNEHNYMREWLKIAKDMDCLIVINTDSHSKYTVGNIDKSLTLLNQVNYPVDLIVNFDEDKIKYYIQRKIRYANPKSSLMT